MFNRLNRNQRIQHAAGAISVGYDSDTLTAALQSAQADVANLDTDNERLRNGLRFIVNHIDGIRTPNGTTNLMRRHLDALLKGEDITQ